MSDERKVKEVNDLLNNLKAIREPYESLIDECIEYGFHSLRKITALEQGGEKTGQTIYDSTASQAIELLGNGLYGSMLSPGWLRVTLPLPVEFPKMSAMRQFNGKRLDDIPQVAKWLSDVQDILVSSIANSNFYGVAPTAFKTAPTIGTMVMDSDYIVGQNRISFTVPHVREIYIGRDRFGNVDTRIRVYKVYLKDAVDMFGKRKMSDVMPDLAVRLERNPFEQLEITHAIFPRMNYDTQKLTSDNMPFASRWIYHKHLLKDSGYKSFPCIVWDWMRNNEEVWGRGAVANAINDILLAQAEGKANINAGSRLADPPYAMMESLRGRNFLRAGGRTYLKNNEQPPVPLDIGLKGIPYTVDMQNRIQQIINKWCYVDIFLMMNQAMMENHNLREVQVYEMSGEKAMIMAPLTERIEKQFLDRIVDVVFEAEYAAGPDGLPTGLIPIPPQIILDISQQIPLKIEVDYQGQLSLARKTFYKSRGIQNAVNSIGMIAQLAPEVTKVLKWTNIAKKSVKDLVSPDDINTDEEIQAMIEAEQAALAEQNALATAAGMADAVPKLSKTVEKGSPLSLIAGGE